MLNVWYDLKRHEHWNSFIMVIILNTGVLTAITALFSIRRKRKVPRLVLERFVATGKQSLHQEAWFNP